MWVQIPLLESSDSGAVGFDKLFFGAGQDGDGIDEVGIIIVNDEDVFVPLVDGVRNGPDWSVKMRPVT